MAHIYQGFQGEYYVIDGIKYDVHFPEEWARDHKDFKQESPYEDYLAQTGPEKCGNCSFYGTLRGVFVGYCSNCAREYNFERGRSFCFDFSQEEMWEKLDYMKNVPMIMIGDEMDTSRAAFDDTWENATWLKRLQKFDEFEDKKDKARKEKKDKKVKKAKKGEERRIRRALRKRRTNEEYIGMPEEPRVEFYIFLLYLSLSFLFLVLIFCLC